MDISEGRPQDIGRTCPLELHVRPYGGSPYSICRRPPQNVCMGIALALHVGPYGNVLRASYLVVLRTTYFNVLRTSLEDVLRTQSGIVRWRHIEDHMGCPQNVFRGSSQDVHRTSFCHVGTAFCYLISGLSFESGLQVIHSFYIAKKESKNNEFF